MTKSRFRRTGQGGNSPVQSRPTRLPQDSVLRAHLRRQADWSSEGPRLCRRPEKYGKRRKLLDAIDRIGGANRSAARSAAAASEKATREPADRGSA